MLEREFSIEEQPEKPPKWAGFIRALIKTRKMDHVPNVADSDHGYAYTEDMVKEWEQEMTELDEATSQENFEQQDGSKIHIQYEKKWNLKIIRELTISTPDQKQQFDFLKLLPEGYILLAELPIRQAKDFMFPPDKVIVVSSSFMSNLGSRLAALHEIGHAMDFTDNPEAYIEYLKNDKERLKGEERAFDYAERLLESLNKQGIQYVPKEFDKTRFDNFKKTALDTLKIQGKAWEHVVGQEKDTRE